MMKIVQVCSHSVLHYRSGDAHSNRTIVLRLRSGEGLSGPLERVFRRNDSCAECTDDTRLSDNL